MKKTNPMLKSLPAAKKIFACLVTLSMVLSLNSTFLIDVAKAQDDLPPPPTEGEYIPEGDMPMDDGAEPYYPEDMGPPPEVLEDMEVTMEDLGLTEPAIKRDSVFYGLKTGIIWPIHEALVFDPVNDAELKAHHADQMLADTQNLVDEEGIENVNPKLLTNSVDWFEDKLEDIKDAAENIKDEKGDQPAEVDAFLDEFADNHFYEHKILEDFDNQITEHKDDIQGAEDVYVVLKDKQDEMLEDFGGVLTTVDDPEKIPERLAAVADAQEGSSFKLIKTAEILKKLEDQVPEQGKAAIENARDRTMDLLEEDMKELPAIVRAEKFEEYTAGLPGDETVQLSIFEELKQLPDIPQDMLEKIEEIKEFAVSRFEEKIEKFDKPEVKDKFFEKLTGNDLDDIMVLEELKAKISAKQSELRSRIEQEHMEGLSEFKAQFTDVESQTQAARFEKLVKEMTTNPNPKIFRLLNELEMEVAQDPEKAAFIDSIKNKSKAEFENKFREEGNRFFDRMASFNPDDMMVFREFEQEQFFDPRMMGQFFDHQTDMYKDHIQNIDDPMMFNRFQERFQYAPPEVINIVKQNNEFEDMMQFKMRQMMEQEIMLKEREMRMQMERDWRLNEDDFQLQMRQVRNDDEKAELFKQRREQDMALMEREFEERKMMMEARFVNDPFCDAMCQEFQQRHMELEFENKQWNLQEDARMREFELDMHMAPDMGFDPFAGKCDSPETCMDFCYQNPDLPECRVHEPMPMGPMGPDYMGPMGPPPCPPGMINMPRGPGNWECVNDPYYKPPEFFKQCPPGNIWNEARGYCEFDEQTFQPVMNMYFGPDPMGSPMPSGGCPPGEWWDPGRNSCIRDDGPMGPGEPGMMPYEPYMPPMNFCGPGEYWDDIRGCVRESFQQCGPNEYFDFYDQYCKKDDWRDCPPGEYWDPGRNGCVRDIMQGPVEQCQPGYFWDFYKGTCIQDQWAPPPPIPPGGCPDGQWWDEYMHMCTGGAGPDPTWPQECKPGDYWDAGANACVPGDMPDCPDNWDPVCGYDNITYSNDCYAKQANIGWQYHGECSPTDTPIPPGGYCGDGRCDGNEYCPQDCDTGNWCGNNVCDSGEDEWSCPSDCGQDQCISCYCGNYVCDPGEDQWSCPSDCGETTPGETCSSMGGTCCNTCADNSYIPGTECNCCRTCETTYCGDYVCDSNETMSSCPSDCGTTPGGACSSMGGTCCNTCAGGSSISGTECNCCSICQGETCPSNSYTTNAGACDYTMCPNGCNFDNQGCPSGCMTTSGWCGDNVCNNAETVTSCPSDCGGTTTGYCGDGTCNLDYETPWDCQQDCGDAVCGDGVCGTNENSFNCQNDCGGGGGACGDGYCEPAEVGSCPSDCGTSSACNSDGICDSNETASSCPNDCSGTTGWCGDNVCNNAETVTSCPADCGSGAGYCGDYVCNSDETSTSCPSDCGSGAMTCNYNGTCDYDETMESCPADCSGGGTMDCNYNGMCDGNETMSSCPDDCGSGAGYCGDGMCDSGEDQWSCSTDCGPATVCGDGMCDSGEDEWSCPSDCGPTTVCGNGMCEAGEDEWSCPSDCGPSDVCGDGMCSGMEDSWSCPSDCGSSEPPPTNGGGGYCGDGICDGGEYCPEDCGGEVLGVMTAREADKVDEQGNIFAKVWQTLKVILTKDEPASRPTVTAYIPHKTLAANPYLKERILWTEGDNYYKLISQYQPRQPQVLGAKTHRVKVKFPLVTVWQILTAPFK